MHRTESSSAVTGQISMKKVHSKAYVVTDLRINRFLLRACGSKRDKRYDSTGLLSDK